ncbi:MAG: hypothetical protein A2Y38_24890 [Spirochaetes bacterium GWB1_59_5]|nr:MAG: hypothetical protein A2Y38_24890 [Spirochaetes bacterium GWB1_59_5]
MSEITEGRYRGEFIYSEACGTRSLETVTLDTGDLAAGTVLGKITKGAATGAAVAGNTGSSGAITAAPAVAAGAKAGVYHAICFEPGTNAGKFLVTDPDGITLGVATVAVEFVGGGLTFTIADATDFVSGDAFTITVAAGSGKYVAYDQDGVNGSEIAAGILYDNANATSADVEVVIVARDAEVNGSELTWPADIEAGEKTTGIAQLAALGIFVR